MKVLITAGSTQVPIDEVRSISNIFKGKTGRAIAHYFDREGAGVTLLASGEAWPHESSFRFSFVNFQTFEELARLMEGYIRNGKFDAVIHSAAVSDFEVARVLDENMQPLDQAGKVSSDHPKLFLEMRPTIKLVDRIRNPWGFKGKLVKFKLQVGKSDEELLEIAEKSRIASGADMVVANCLEWAKEYAYVVGPGKKMLGVERVSRDHLPRTLYWRLAND